MAYRMGFAIAIPVSNDVMGEQIYLIEVGALDSEHSGSDHCICLHVVESTPRQKGGFFQNLLSTVLFTCPNHV